MGSAQAQKAARAPLGFFGAQSDPGPGLRTWLVAFVVAGAGPIGRFVYVYPTPRSIGAAIGFAVVAWFLARRASEHATGFVWRTDGPLMAVVVGLCLLSLPASPAMSDPTRFARAILPVWIIGALLLALWTVGGLRMPWLGRFDRRLVAPVVCMSLVVGASTRATDRLWRSLGLAVATACVAALVALRPRQTESVLAPIRAFWHETRRAAPWELVLSAGGALAWLSVNTGVWVIGVMRGHDLLYGAWLAGIYTQPGWVYVLISLSGLVLVSIGVLAVGVLVTLHGAGVLIDVARWVLVAAALGAVGGFFWYWAIL